LAIPNTSFRTRTSHIDQHLFDEFVYNRAGQGNGGFPIHRTAMLYTPKEYGTLNEDTDAAMAKTSVIVRAASVIAAAVAAVVF
jgi:hypothetical protein